MKNSILVSIEFYFKGKKYSPSLTLDLDVYMATRGAEEAIYQLLANSNGIDLYSYEYEMMQAEKLVFSQATGLATDFLEDSVFNFAGFSLALDDEGIVEMLSKIASEHLSVNDLSAQPALEAALLAAYKLGQKKGPTIV